MYGHLSKNCPQWAFTQQNYLRNTTPVATPLYLSRSNTPPLVFPSSFSSKQFSKLTQQLTTDFTLNPHVWNETAHKMNEMAEENRLINQALHLWNTKGKYPISRDRNQNNPKDDSGKQITQSGKKSLQFKSNTSTGTGHFSTVTISGSTMHSNLKSNPKFGN